MPLLHATLLTHAEGLTRNWLHLPIPRSTTRQRSAVFADRAVELAMELLSPGMGAALRARYDATYAMLDQVNVTESTRPYSRWGKLRDDVSHAVRAVVGHLKKYNTDLRPHHSVYFFTGNVGRLDKSQILPVWAAYWAEFECMCCGHGGPCPADEQEYYFPDAEAAHSEAGPCPAISRHYGRKGSPTPIARVRPSQSAAPNARRSTVSGSPRAESGEDRDAPEQDTDDAESHGAHGQEGEGKAVGIADELEAKEEGPAAKGGAG